MRTRFDWIGLVLLWAGACGPTVDPVGDGDTADDATGSIGDGPGGTTTTTTTATTTATTTTTTGVDSTGPDPTTTAGGLELEDWYLLAVAPSLSPNTPLQFLAFASGKGGALVVELQPLSLDVGSTTEPREPLPDAAIELSSGLTGSGQFTLEAIGYLVPGQANPITGSDLTVDMTVDGAFVDPTFACGVVDGEVLTPINASLLGSTFAMVRLEDPEMLPLEFPTSCD